MLCLFNIFFSINSIRALFIDNLKISYLVSYINLLSPKILITSIDNDKKFYQLKKYFYHIKFISFQNGFRRKTNDFFEHTDKSENLLCDYFYAWGHKIASEYKKFIKAKYIIFGSLKTYFINKDFFYKKKKPLIYISQTKKSFYYLKNENQFNVPAYFRYEKKLLRLLCQYCFSKNITLTILNRTDSKNEIKYFKKILTCKFKFIKIKDFSRIKKYKILGDYQLAVTIMSSLGLENFSLGRKTVFFPPTICKNINPFNDIDISWPGKTENNDLFFFRNPNLKSMSSLLDNAFKISIHDWKTRIAKFNKIIIAPNKKKLDNLFQNFISCD
jgi:surface carbohydrate biosynthesis protein